MTDLLAKWKAIASSTEPIDLDSVTRDVQEIYKKHNLPQPDVIGVSSPMACHLLSLLLTNTDYIPRGVKVRTNDQVLDSILGNALNIRCALGRIKRSHSVKHIAPEYPFARPSQARERVQHMIRRQIRFESENASWHNKLWFFEPQLFWKIESSFVTLPSVLDALSGYGFDADRELTAPFTKKSRIWYDANLPFVELSKKVGYIVANSAYVIVSDRPKVNRNNAREWQFEGSANTPVLEYRDGWEVRLRGSIPISPWEVNVPRTREDVRKLQRDEAINVLSLIDTETIVKTWTDKFLIDTDSRFGKLWQVWVPIYDTLLAVRIAEVVNGTPEPDGSFKTYYLRVPRDIGNIDTAIAWTYGMRTAEYRTFLQQRT